MFYVRASIICVSPLLCPMYCSGLISPPAGPAYDLLKATESNTEMIQDSVVP